MYNDYDYEATTTYDWDDNHHIITTINRPTEIQALKNLLSYRGRLNTNEELLWQMELSLIANGETPATALDKVAVAVCFTKEQCEKVFKKISVKLFGLDKAGYTF